MRLTLYCIVSVFVPSLTDEPTVRPEIEEVSFSRAPGKDSNRGLVSGMISNEKFIEGKNRAVGLRVIRHQAVHYPPVAEGDLVPMVGFVYRIEKVNVGISAKWAKPTDFPDIIYPAADSLTIPVMRFDQGGSCQFRMTTVYVREIGKDGRGLFADLQTSDPLLAGKVRVRVGDSLAYDSSSRKVRNIVPLDQKTGVIGWVEFSPETSALPR